MARSTCLRSSSGRIPATKPAPFPTGYHKSSEDPLKASKVEAQILSVRVLAEKSLKRYPLHPLHKDFQQQTQSSLFLTTNASFSLPRTADCLQKHHELSKYKF